MVLRFPSRSRPAPPPAAVAGGHADWRELLAQLQAAGGSAGTEGLQRALRQLGCHSEREALVLLLRALVDDGSATSTADTYIPY